MLFLDRDSRCRSSGERCFSKIICLKYRLHVFRRLFAHFFFLRFSSYPLVCTRCTQIVLLVNVTKIVPDTFRQVKRSSPVLGTYPGGRGKKRLNNRNIFRRCRRRCFRCPLPGGTASGVPVRSDRRRKSANHHRRSTRTGSRRQLLNNSNRSSSNCARTRQTNCRRRYPGRTSR